jgi:hypothetical protein
MTFRRHYKFHMWRKCGRRIHHSCLACEPKDDRRLIILLVEMTCHRHVVVGTYSTEMLCSHHWSFYVLIIQSILQISRSNIRSGWDIRNVAHSPNQLGGGEKSRTSTHCYKGGKPAAPSLGQNHQMSLMCSTERIVGEAGRATGHITSATNQFTRYNWLDHLPSLPLATHFWDTIQPRETRTCHIFILRNHDEMRRNNSSTQPQGVR